MMSIMGWKEGERINKTWSLYIGTLARSSECTPKRFKELLLLGIKHGARKKIFVTASRCCGGCVAAEAAMLRALSA